jgi:phosphopantothenoylcysteine decarboxylase / phosphopantothenate---cysteine ligase
LDAGAGVTLITTVNLPAPTGAQIVPVTSALEMQAAVLQYSALADALIMAAAVADFRPSQVADQKIKKKDDTEGLTIELMRNPDILLSVREQRQQTGYPRAVVGFAAESEHLLENAQGKLERKGLDLLVANDITATDAGFATDTNRVVLLTPEQNPTRLDLMGKDRVGEVIIQRVVALLER